MKFMTIVLTLLFVFVQSLAARSEQPSASPNALTKQVTKIVSGGPAQVEQQLWKATHVLRRQFEGKSWGKVRAIVEREGWTNDSPDSEDLYFDKRFVVKANAFSDGKFSQDVYVEFEIDARNSGKSKIDQAIVQTARAGIEIKANAPVSDFLATTKYLTASVVARVLRHEEVSKLAGRFPVLDKVCISYDRLWDKNSEHVWSGYQVDVSLKRTAAQEQQDVSRYFTVYGNRDPITDWNGRKVDVIYVLTSDEEIQCWGGSGPIEVDNGGEKP